MCLYRDGADALAYGELERCRWHSHGHPCGHCANLQQSLKQALRYRHTDHCIELHVKHYDVDFLTSMHADDACHGPTPHGPTPTANTAFVGDW